MRCASTSRRRALRSASAAGTTATMSAATPTTRRSAAAASATSLAPAKPGASRDALTGATREEVRMNPPRTGLWVWLGVALIVIVVDQLTKTLIVGQFALHD